MAAETENITKSMNKSLNGESSSTPEMEREFVERLKTYIEEQRWVTKPLAMSPTVCSQYGWKCIRSDLLKCVTCTEKLIVHPPSMENYEAYKASLNKFLKDLKDSHRKDCPWPLTPSPENFVKMTAVPKEEALCQFLRRLKTCLRFKDSIPEMKESVLLDLGLRKYHISVLCSVAEVHSVEASHLGKSLVILAATGWTLTSGGQESERIFLTCINCQRHTWSGYFNCIKYETGSKKVGSGTNASESVNETLLAENETGSKKVGSETNASESVNETLLAENETGSKKVGSETNASVSVNETLLAENETGSLDQPPKKRKFSLLLQTDEPFDPLHEHRSWCLWIAVNSSKDKSPLKNPNEIKTADEVESIPGWKIYMKSLLRSISGIPRLKTRVHH